MIEPITTLQVFDIYKDVLKNYRSVEIKNNKFVISAGGPGWVATNNPLAPWVLLLEQL